MAVFALAYIAWLALGVFVLWRITKNLENFNAIAALIVIALWPLYVMGRFYA